MDWTRAVDLYCERIGPGFWAEPVNALTNAAFVFVGLWLWRGARGIESVLVALLLAIGVGSFLFHTFATPLAGLADVLPIALFTVCYVYAAHRRYLGMSTGVSLAAAGLFLPYVIAGGWLFGRVPFFSISASYWPIATAILAYGALLLPRSRQVGRGLLAAGALLALSLAARALDGAVCPAVPLGTHFAWHLLNAVVLGMMITLLKRHRLEPQAHGR